MKYFDDNNIYESEDDEDIEVLDDDEDDDGYIFQLDKALDINKKHEQEFNEIIENSTSKLDHYWDINDPFVRLILGILFGIGAIGSIYYITMWILG